MNHQSSRLPESIRTLAVPQGHLAIWALGQQGYIFKGGDTVVVIDPYLSNHIEEQAGESTPFTTRMIPIAVPPGDLDMVDVAFTTHHHADHCDPASLGPIMEASPSARLIGSYSCREHLQQNGVSTDRMTVPEVGKTESYAVNLQATAIPSAHYSEDRDSNGNPAYLGFLLDFNGVKLYHSGDTIIYDGLLEAVRAFGPDITCLPINGRDWFREQHDIVGNMNYREAADFSTAVGAKVLLPGHNDLLAGNRVNPAYLTDYITTAHFGSRFHFLMDGELYYFAG